MGIGLNGVGFVYFYVVFWQLFFCDYVKDVFGDVGGMVVDLFNVFGIEKKMDIFCDYLWIFYYVGEQFVEQRCVDCVYFCVGFLDFVCSFCVLCGIGV